MDPRDHLAQVGRADLVMRDVGRDDVGGKRDQGLIRPRVIPSCHENSWRVA